jgi:hypothetical protein
MSRIVQYIRSFKERKATSTVQYATDAELTINWRFLNYPFNFDQAGGMREDIGIRGADLEIWMQFTGTAAVRKAKPKAKPRLKLILSNFTKFPAATSPTLPQPTPVSEVTQPNGVSPATAFENVEETHHATQDTNGASNDRNDNISPDTVFNYAMKALNEMNNPDHTRVKEFEEELSKVKQESRKHQVNAAKAQEEVIRLQIKFETETASLTARLIAKQTRSAE